MSDFFNRDNAYNSFMTKAFDLCLLNLMLFVTSLPYFTLGASLTAYYRVALAVTRNSDSGIIRSYFSEFKRSFGKSTLLFIVPGLILPLLLFDLYFWSHLQNEMRPIGYTASIIMLLLWACWMFWLFPLSAAYENTNINTMRNAVKFAVSFMPATIAMSAAGLAYCAVILFHNALWAFVPVFALSLMLYPQSLYVSRVFGRYNEEQRRKEGRDDKGDI